jgi:hypothetical protein
LRRYAFAPLFRVERTIDARARDVPSVLAELEIDRVDWLKIDSQGTDLRLLLSLGEGLVRRLLVVELEPGLIDAYDGEDKLADVLAEMDARGFWSSELNVRGSTRIDSELAKQALGPRASRYLDVCHKTAPGWVELEYFNDFADAELFGKRELLLGYAFAFLRGHHAFALELACKGRERFGPPFAELERAALRRIKAGFARLPVAAVGARILRR